MGRVARVSIDLWSYHDIPDDPKPRRFILHKVFYYETTETTHRPLSRTFPFATVRDTLPILMSRYHDDCLTRPRLLPK
jgi:hypothetical protein